MLSWRFLHEAHSFRDNFFACLILTSTRQFTVSPENVLVRCSAPLIFAKQHFPELLQITE
jgi:hypothetical protein